MKPSYERGELPTGLRSDTIATLLRTNAAARPSALAIISRHQGVRLTYEQLATEVERVAGGLIACDVGPRDRVAVAVPNGFESIVLQHAVASVGATLVALNPTERAHELDRLVENAGAVMWITAEPSADTRRPGVRAVHVSARRAEGWMSWRDLLDAGDSVGSGPVRGREAGVGPDDPASILYTSGTTGRPRGATMSHRSLVNSAFHIGERLAYTPADRLCLPVPLCHAFGSVLGWLALLTHGGTLVLPAPVFDVAACLDAIEEERCTAFYGVPTMFGGVLAHPAFAPERVQSLRTGVMAGAPCPVALMEAVVDRMHIPEVAICYGTTETGTLCQSQPTDPIEQRVNTVGAVHPGFECQVVDPATREVVPRGSPGELWARGYSAMLGYWNDPEATRAAFENGGWMRTGDLAIMRDDGYVNIVGRLKEIIISAGQNIHPREIEDVLRAHPRIRDAAVVGVPDHVHGETACAWIVPREPETLTADEVRRFCCDRLALYKVPRRVCFIDRFPTTATGKVQKFVLRDRAVARFGLGGLAQVPTA